MTLEIFLWVVTFGIGPFIGYCVHAALANIKTASAIALVSKRLKEIEDNQERIDQTCTTTLEMHQHYDGDGTPLWYIPRSWAATQVKIVDICQEISQAQVSIASCLERMERREK